MSALRLKTVMAACGITQTTLSLKTGVPRHEINQLVNHGHWPRSKDRSVLMGKIVNCVRAASGNTKGLFYTDKPKGHARSHVLRGATSPSPITDDPHHVPVDHPDAQPEEEELAMLLRKQTLTRETLRHFELPKDPFSDPTCFEDVFLNADMRYVRESMYQVARHGGFLAVIGESGSGKSTLREELEARLQREDQAVIIAKPYVLAMEGHDKVGKTLRSHHLAEALMASVAPLAARGISGPDARFRQLHHALRDSARAGHAHVLIIEEAQCLPTATLKHLKRFRELKDGLRPLLSIILLGQSELALKLSEHNPEVREVVQRIEIVTLQSLGNDLEAYLKHRFLRAGVAIEKVMAKGAVDALRTKLTPTRASGTLLYPLAVANALTAAMNRTAEIKSPQVTADVVAGI